MTLCYGMIMKVDGKGKDLGKGEEQFFFLENFKYIPWNESCAYSINYPKWVKILKLLKEEKHWFN